MATVQPLASPLALGLGVLPQDSQAGGFTVAEAGGFTVAETEGEADEELVGSTLSGGISGGAIPMLTSPFKH